MKAVMFVMTKAIPVPVPMAVVLGRVARGASVLGIIMTRGAGEADLVHFVAHYHYWNVGEILGLMEVVEHAKKEVGRSN